LWLDFSSISITELAQEYNKSVLNFLRVAEFVTPSLAVFEAAIRVKINASDKIMFENQKKKENMEIKRTFTYSSL